MVELSDFTYIKGMKCIKSIYKKSNLDWSAVKEAYPTFQYEMEYAGLPDSFGLGDYLEFVSTVRENMSNLVSVSPLSPTITIQIPNPEKSSTTSDNQYSAWQLYRKRLEQSGIKDDDIGFIESSAKTVLGSLQHDTVETGPVKGLVVGNVQSGKTANMAALMSMAADAGWNMFIILSGTIENLRIQTMNRMKKDLQDGNVVWKFVNNPNKFSWKTIQPDFTAKSRIRYVAVTLKVAVRLKNIIQWLQSDPNITSKLKVLVIDDEADQASINTGNIEDDKKRKTINRLILNLVHCRDVAAKSSKDNKYKGHYQSMNYIGYTATPYGNILNEYGDETLYPKNIVHSLHSSSDYFGPSTIFGTDDHKDHLDVVRIIPDSELKLFSGKKSISLKAMPKAMEESILWFLCSASIARINGYKKPISMLIHTSMKQNDHEEIFRFLISWFKNAKNEIVEKCRSVYSLESTKFTKNNLFECIPLYSVPKDEIWDYPEFDSLIPFIEELVGEISGIRMVLEEDEQGEIQKKLTFCRGIHLCVDNCANNGVDDNGIHLRLAYPDAEDPNAPDYSTAFIVIGGNTLARGLTLQGLVSTYFGRSVKQADTLMQMGRWFGYRKHYELLPRIWMGQETSLLFQYLATMDKDLRDQLEEVSLLKDSTPSDYCASVLEYPLISKMRITAKNKSQQANYVNYVGLDHQMTSFYSDKLIRASNIEMCEAFLKSLPKPRKSDFSDTDYIWDNVSYADLKVGIIDHYQAPPTSRFISDWWIVDNWLKQNLGDPNNIKFNIIAAGRSIADDIPVWVVSPGCSIGIVSRSCVRHGESFNVNTLAGKSDYIADINLKESKLNYEQIEAIRKDITSANISRTYRAWRRRAGMQDVPVLVLYKFYTKDSMERGEMEFSIGMSVIFPVNSENTKYKRVGIVR